MKTLFILRHAKSSWADAELADFDRPLNGRGEKAAAFMGGFVRAKEFEPQIILSSPAVRATTTAELVKKASRLTAEIKLDERIYEAHPHQLRQIVSEISDDIDQAMLVGHNPGLEGLVRYLTGRMEPMPTAALAVIDLDVKGWDMVDNDRGELRAIFRPKEEMNDS